MAGSSSTTPVASTRRIEFKITLDVVTMKWSSARLLAATAVSANQCTLG